MADRTWSEWKRATRFFESARIAVRHQNALWNALQKNVPNGVRISSTDGTSRFGLSLAEYLEALGDEPMLCTLLLVHSYALAEAAAAAKLCKHVPLGGIEGWGKKILEANGQGWGKVKGGEAGLVEVGVVRNTLAHGSRKIDEQGAKRLAKAKSSLGWKSGHVVNLNADLLDEYRARLKALLRVAGINKTKAQLKSSQQP